MKKSVLLFALSSLAAFGWEAPFPLVSRVSGGSSAVIESDIHPGFAKNADTALVVRVYSPETPNPYGLPADAQATREFVYRNGTDWPRVTNVVEGVVADVVPEISVPYSGAKRDVDLGSRKMSAGSVRSGGYEFSGYPAKMYGVRTSPRVETNVLFNVDVSKFSVGVGSFAEIGYNSSAFGCQAEANGSSSVANGFFAKAPSDRSIAVGAYSQVSQYSDDATVIGYNASVADDHSGAVVIGANGSSHGENTLNFSTTENPNDVFFGDSTLTEIIGDVAPPPGDYEAVSNAAMNAHADAAEMATGAKNAAVAEARSRTDSVADVITNALNQHVSNTGNPHAVTKAQVGLGSVADHAQATSTEAPVSGSSLYWTSGAMYNTINTSMPSSPSATKVPSSKLVNGLLALKQDKLSTSTSPFSGTWTFTESGSSVTRVKNISGQATVVGNCVIFSGTFNLAQACNASEYKIGVSFKVTGSSAVFCFYGAANSNTCPIGFYCNGSDLYFHPTTSLANGTVIKFGGIMPL